MGLDRQIVKQSWGEIKMMPISFLNFLIYLNVFVALVMELAYSHSLSIKHLSDEFFSRIIGQVNLPEPAEGRHC